VALDALRAQQEIDQISQVRQQRQRQQPAERGHRLPLLQDDPRAQRYQVEQPCAGDPPLQVGQRAEDVAEGAGDIVHAAILCAVARLATQAA